MNPSFTQEQVVKAYDQAPAQVRDAFSSDETVEVVMGIKTLYNLHVDTAGILGKEIGYLLLGLISPDQFQARLVASGTDKETVRGIMEAINRKIFIPLQGKLRSSPAPSPKPAAPVAAPTKPAAEPAARKLPVSAPQPIQNTASVAQNPENLPIMAPPTASISAPAAQNVHIYVAPQMQQQAPTQQAPTHVFVPVSVPMQQPAAPFPVQYSTQEHLPMRTMASDMQMAQNMRESIAHPVQQPIPPEPKREVPPASPQNIVPAQPPVQQVATPIERSSDPYREPV